MIIKNGKTISARYKGTKEIIKRYKGTLVVYESFKNLLISGVPPLTLVKCKGVDLIDYKIYGHSIQNGTPTLETPIEVESVGDRTRNLIDINGKRLSFDSYSQHVLTNEELEENDVFIGITQNGYVGYAHSMTYEVNGSIVDFSIYGGGYGIGYKIKNISQTGTYCVNCDADFTERCAVVKILDGEIIPIKTINGAKGTFEVDDINSYYVFIIRPDKGTFSFKDMQIEPKEVTEYEPYGYKIPVKVRGKNLWNEKWVNGSITNDTGAFNSANTNLVCVEDFISVEPSSEYTLNVGVGNTAWIFQYDSSKGYLGVGKRITVNNYLTFTTDNNTHYIKFYLATSYGNAYKNDVILSIGLTDYEPYVEPITTNIYLDKPLGKTDDVAEYIDFQNKEFKSQIKEVVFNGSESWSLNTALVDKGVHRFHMSLSDAYYGSAINTSNQCKCSHFDTSSNMANANAQGIKNGAYMYLRMVYFYTDATMFPDLETWKEWLSNNNVKFRYKLAEESTPVAIELPNIPTIKGTTIIEVDTDVQPSNMEVTYKGKGE